MEDAQKTKLQELVDKAYLAFGIKPKADTATTTNYSLKDGTKVQCVGGAMKVGCPVHMVDQDMNSQPMPDGEHTLSDETVMSVVGGKVSSLTNPSDADEQSGGDTADNENTEMKAEFEAFKTEFEAFKLEFSELKTANEALTGENLVLKTAFETAKTELDSQKIAFSAQKEDNEKVLDLLEKVLALPADKSIGQSFRLSGTNTKTETERIALLGENMKALRESNKKQA